MPRVKVQYSKQNPRWACSVCYRGYNTKAKAAACERKHVSKMIAEEMITGKYPRKQAIAIGLSRARKVDWSKVG